MARFTVGVDVGGTFTDLFLWSHGEGVETFKVLSTPEDPSLGVLEGLARMATSQGLQPGAFAGEIGLIVHGTTVTTNAVLTRGGARCGLITTQGVRDALEMRRGIREKQYDNRYLNVVPLVPRRRRLAVRGRLDAEGDEIAPLSQEDVRAAALKLAADGVQAVAICFLHAYADARHEQQAARLVREHLPDAFLSVSSEVLPSIRFYDRVSTVALNAYVGPVLEGYLNSLTDRLEQAGFTGVLLIMQSNGGVALPAVTLRRPATTLLSGPAAGPRAAAAFAGLDGSGDCVLMDMGGTSFDASLVRDGDAALCNDGSIDRLRIALPMLDITTIGAGGGSIGWIDEGGLLRMGPASAGAAPGPACYGRGGSEPTCTDADLLLGYLDPAFFAGGDIVLDPDAARQAIAEHIAAPLGLTVEQAAAGMYRVINANMAHGVREITVRRGVDPREFPLVVAGGAGALHAAAIALDLDMPSLLVPGPSSTLCAVGMLLSDLQHDFVRSFVGPLDGLDPAAMLRLTDEMAAEGEEHLRAEGAERTRHVISLDLRYLQQYHEVTVPVPRDELEAADLQAVARRFHAEHDRLYGYELQAEGTGLELINLRLRSVGQRDLPPLPRVEAGGADASGAIKGHRQAYVPEREAFERLPVYDGHALRAGQALTGPALVERRDTTAFVSASFDARVDACGSLVLRRTDAGPAAGAARATSERVAGGAQTS